MKIIPKPGDLVEFIPSGVRAENAHCWFCVDAETGEEKVIEPGRRGIILEIMQYPELKLYEEINYKILLDGVILLDVANTMFKTISIPDSSVGRAGGC